MIKNLKFMLALLLVGGFSSSTLFAQSDDNDDAHDVTINIPEVAILDIEGGTAITLSPEAPEEAGEALDFTGAGATDNSLWLNYSSIIGSTTESTRKVSVVLAGTVPGGMLVKLEAAADNNGGEGTVGTVSSELTLSTSPQDVITGIGSCYTGTGTSKGHNLTYSLEYDGSNYADLDFDDATTLTVTYTISDN